MNFLYKMYYLLPNDNKFGIISKIINRLTAKFLKIIFDFYYPYYYKKTSNNIGSGINDIQGEGPKIIVSLTSFPGRINEIWICIESLLRQKYKPHMLILWLTKEQFEGKELPSELVRLCDRGLTIRWVDENIRSYTKFYYVMKEYPDDIVVTVDDDIYYIDTFLQDLITLHKKYPKAICANRVHKIRFSKEGEIMPYNKWIHSYSTKMLAPEPNLFVTGVGGVLYPPHCMSKELFDKDAFTKICPLADDIWLNLCAIKKGTEIVVNNRLAKDSICISKTQKNKLVLYNVVQGGNDTQIKSVVDFLQIKFQK